MIEDALRFSFEKLTKDELVELAILLTVEGIHSAGRKKQHIQYRETYDNIGNIPEFIFKTRIEAEAVLETLKEYFDKYSQISLADVNETCGQIPSSLDNTIGWTSFDGVGIKRIKDGWQLLLPRPTRL